MTSSLIYTSTCRHGKGVFAARDLKKGEIILPFSGPIITLKQALAKGEKSCNPLQRGGGGKIKRQIQGEGERKRERKRGGEGKEKEKK